MAGLVNGAGTALRAVPASKPPLAARDRLFLIRLVEVKTSLQASNWQVVQVSLRPVSAKLNPVLLLRKQQIAISDSAVQGDKELSVVNPLYHFI